MMWLTSDGELVGVDWALTKRGIDEALNLNIFSWWRQINELLLCHVILATMLFPLGITPVPMGAIGSCIGRWVSACVRGQHILCKQHCLGWCLWQEINVSATASIAVLCGGYRVQYGPLNRLIVLVLLPEALLAYGYCHRLCLCVCVCVYLCVCQLLLVRAITHHTFHLQSPDSDKKMQNILLKVPIVLGAD